jgi:iron complex outermembrane recepter protein
MDKRRNLTASRALARNSRLAQAIGLALACAATPVAWSQNAPAADEELETIVVTGYRQSLETGLAMKREESGVVDMILAEDIADFPDLNLAESIQRIPGVVIDRVAGEGKQISVRGLSPEFTRVRINGMEALTTTSATDAVGTNRGRAFDFNVFASELFSSIAVRKTSSAEIDEGSLGATVELSTARPLDFGEPTLVLSYQQGYNDLSESFDPRVAGVASWVNTDNTFGVLASVAYSDRTIREEGAQSGGWERNSNTGADRWGSCPACTTPEQTTAVNNAVHARFPRYVGFDHEQERLGLTGSLQWRPNEATTFSVDVLYSNLDSTRTEPFLEAISFARGNAAGRGSTDVLAFEIDGNNTMVYGQFDDVDVRSENRYDVWNTEFLQYSATLKYEPTDDLRIDLLAGTSESNLEVEKQTTIILENFDSDGYSYDFRGNDQRPAIVYGFDTTDPANWVVSEVRERPSTNDNSFDTFRMDVAYDLTDVWTMKTGMSWKKYGFDVAEARRDKTLPIATASCNLPRQTVTDADGRVISNGQDRFFIADVNAMADRIGLYTNDACFPLVTSVNDTRSVEEDDFGVHLQLDFSTEVLGLPFRGDLGVRYVETEMASTGIQVIAGANVPVVAQRSYSDTLPAVNLVLEPFSDFLVRASYSQVMSRPSLGSLTPGGSINGFAVPPTVSFGNPYLDPFRADAYDLSFEWYYAQGALISLALFKKEIESFTVSTRESKPWSELGLPDSLLDQVPADPDDIFDVRSITNGDGGDLDGFEIQWQQPFNFFGEGNWYNNFGLLANYTNVSSEVNYGTPAAPLIRDLNGLSEESYNATLYYDDQTLMIRLSYAYRDQYQRAATSRAGNDLDWTEEMESLDMSASYRLNRNFKFSFEALNLTDEVKIDRMDSVAGRMENSLGAGMQFYLGVQYTY